MNISDPFKVPTTAPPVNTEHLPPCVWFEPVPEGSPSTDEPTQCGEAAEHKIRVKERLSSTVIITDAWIDVCGKHKAMHDERAAAYRSEKRRNRRR